MSGHSKWSQIKNKKAKNDQDKGRLFSKFSKAISVAAKTNPDPKFNIVLRAVIEQARKMNMPAANIERAISKANEVGDLEELLIEAYAPEGVGILIKAITDSRNRTISEIKVVFRENDAKIAEPGALAWAFEKRDHEYTAKFTSTPSEEARGRVAKLIEALEDRDDVQEVYSTIGE